MSPQKYEPVNSLDDDDHESPVAYSSNTHVPSSPPPSFRSRASSPTSRRLLSQDPLGNSQTNDLDDAFDDGDPSDEENEGDDRQRLMRANSGHGSNLNTPVNETRSEAQPRVERRVMQLPSFSVPTPTTGSRTIRPTNDGVFANLMAKPERGDPVDEKPPSYEQAAADATPPYWETTVLAPGMSGDEVYVDGLPVGSLFSFIWNGMISTSFQLVGFLLTYLLHTTHAAKNGSRAGLGLTLVQYGFFTGGASSPPTDGNSGQFAGSPPDPNSHDFDPGNVNGQDPAPGSGSGLSSSDWISYVLMIVGWFILIRAVVDFLRVKRHERMVLASPSRGLNVPIVAEGESPETSA